MTHTPIETHGGFLVKRDDLFTVAGVSGGKARTCWALAQGAPGLVTAGSRFSPQVNIVAHIARHLGIPCAVVTPTGKPGPEVEGAIAAGAEHVAVTPGYNGVICKRAKDLAKERRWTYIPFGMECSEAVKQTAGQVGNVLDAQPKRIVIPVGSGMSFAGVLEGVALAESYGFGSVPVLGVQVGADPSKRLNAYAPFFWPQMGRLVPSELPYDTRCEERVGDLRLDPIYEAKCVRFLQPGDLLWVVGIREEARCRS